MRRTAALDPDDLTYGETPLASAIWILWKLGLRRGRTLIDLGAGRGRVLIAARWLGAQGVGVEVAVEHVSMVKKAMEGAGARIVVGDATSFAWESKEPVSIYVNWTAFASATRRRMEERLLALPKGSTVACPTWPIESDRFELMFTTRAPLTWGVELVRGYELKGDFPREGIDGTRADS